MENLNDMGISQIRIKWGLYPNFYHKIAQTFHSFKNIIINKFVCNKEIKCGFLRGYYDARNVSKLPIVPNHCPRTFFFTRKSSRTVIWHNSLDSLEI